MKAACLLYLRRGFRPIVPLFLAAALIAPSARAGLSVILEVAHERSGAFPPATYTNYQILVWGISADANLPAAPSGSYVLSSPTGVISEGFQVTGNTVSGITGSDSGDFPDYNSFISELTNGNWTIAFSNATTTNLYTFKVTTPGFSSASLPNVTILNPAAGATNVTNSPVFSWQPLSATGVSDIQVSDNCTEPGFFQENFLSSSQSNWVSPVHIPDGPNTFMVDYVGSLSSSGLAASTPVDSQSHPISAWNFQAFLDNYALVSFDVANHAPGAPGLTPLVAHYNFNDGSLAATDSSGNGNDLTGYYSDSGGTVSITNDALEGADAASFATQYSFSGGDYYTGNTNLLKALAGSFSVSLWLKTTQVAGSDFDDGIYNGAGIVSALAWDHISSTNFANPMVLTGHKLAFVTVGSEGTDPDTLYSGASINTGGYVHLVVTRNQSTGEKRIYVNGSLNASDFGTTDMLDGSKFLQIGMNNGQGFNGKLDDLQFYSTALSASQVLQLYQHPNTTAFAESIALKTALDATNLTWSTSGNAGWFGETTVTHDGVSAAQSGAIDDSEFSDLTTVVPTNGQISFWWKVSSEEFSDVLSFYINGEPMDEISGDVDWTQDSFPVSAGDTLTWEYSKDVSVSEGADAGWVDQVQFTPPTVIGPVTANFDLLIERSADALFGQQPGYTAIPELTLITPAPVTTHQIRSSDGAIHTEVDTGQTSWSTSQSPSYATLDQLIFAITNGLWTLDLDQGDSGEEEFSFQISISGLTTNVLGAATMIVPALNATNVATNTPFQWSGPAGFYSVFINTYHFPSFASYGSSYYLDGTVTNWASPPTLDYGTNGVTLLYTSNHFTGITMTIPTNGAASPVSSWTTTSDLEVLTEDPFVVGQPAPLPVILSGSPTVGGGGGGGGTFQLGFQTLAGRPETIQMRTNLVTGDWVDLTNFIGDGTDYQLQYAISNSPGAYFRVISQ